jgi:hypothetical protein
MNANSVLSKIYIIIRIIFSMIKLLLLIVTSPFIFVYYTTKFFIFKTNFKKQLIKAGMSKNEATELFSTIHFFSKGRAY